MNSPSTQTMTDHYKELKDLKLEINKFKAEKEIAWRELQEYQSALTAIRNEFKDKVGIDDLKNAVLENIINNRLKYNIDAYEQRIAALDQQKAEKEPELDMLNLELREVRIDTIQKKKELNELQKEASKKRNENDAFNKDAGMKAEALLATINSLTAEKKKIEKEIADYQSEYDSKRTFILNEEVRLANRKSDLNIYEVRLRKKYLELAPEMEIIL